MIATELQEDGGPAFGEGALIVCDTVVRIFRDGPVEVQALQGLDLVVERGESIAIVGGSGSGKSTLLTILSGLDAPTAGRASVAGHDLVTMTSCERTRYRRVVVGSVQQQTARNLLPYLSAEENVMLPMSFAGASRRARRARAAELLDAVGAADRARRRPAELSGGEQQRVAIAVALANGPEVLLADEPTGELDSVTGDAVLTALQAVNAAFGTAVVVVTHDAAVAARVDRVVAIRDGRTASEVLRRVRVDADGAATTTAEEYAVLDRSGRLVLPAGYRAALGLRDRVRLELEPDHVGIWPDAPAQPSGAPSGRGGR